MVSTVRDADRIIILDHGTIQDIGSHDDLLKRNDLYRQLCEMQLFYVEYNNENALDHLTTCFRDHWFHLFIVLVKSGLKGINTL